MKPPPPELISELLHSDPLRPVAACQSDDQYYSPSQWALKWKDYSLLMKCLANKQLPQQQIALKAQDVLTDLEMRVILRMACCTSNACETCPRTRSLSWQ